MVAYAEQAGIGPLPPVEGFQAVVGEGVQGVVDGHEVFVGLSRTGAEATSRVVVDGADAGGLAFRDDPKPDAAATLAELQDSFGISAFLVTGDSQAAAEAVAAEVGMPASQVRAGVKPLQKAEAVAAIKAQEQGVVVAFVGDGINDAPALAAADVGIAMASGTDVALDAGSVVLMRNRLADIAVALRLSAATMRKIKQNLFWALIYNWAGAAMALSSVSVVANSLLLKRFRPR